MVSPFCCGLQVGWSELSLSISHFCESHFHSTNEKTGSKPALPVTIRKWNMNRDLRNVDSVKNSYIVLIPKLVMAQKVRMAGRMRGLAVPSMPFAFRPDRHQEVLCSHGFGCVASAAAERGGTTPFNLMPISNGGQPRGDHPSTTPQQLAEFWCKYIVPENGVLLDCFAGSGGILTSGLDNGASKVIGVEKEQRYVDLAWQRIREA